MAASLNAVTDDIGYINLSGSTDITDNDEAYLERSFMWMKVLLTYFPMWLPIIDKKERNKYLSITIICLSSIAVIYHATDVSWWIFDASENNKESTVWDIVYLTFEVLVTITRFICLFYFYKHFKFPFKSYIMGFADITYAKYANTIRKCNIFILVIVSIVACSDLLQTYTYVKDDLAESDTFHIITSIIADICSRVFLYWPLNICVYLCCCIFIKYYLYMLHLMDMVKTGHQNGKIEFDLLLEKYKIMSDAFNYDFHLYLKITVEIYLFASVLGIWSDISSKVTWATVTESIVNALNLMLYPVVASLITDTYERFDKLLWKYCMENTGDESHYKQLLLNYVMKYPFAVKVGNLRISRRNIVTFLIVFVATKLMAYLLELEFQV